MNQSFDIDGVTYSVSYFDPFLATSVLRKIGVVISPVIGAIGSAALSDKKLLKSVGDKKKLDELLASEDNDGDADWGGASERAVMGFFQNFSDELQRELIELLKDVTTVRVEDADVPLSTIFTVHFRGNILNLYKWLFFSLKVQFADFFEGIAPVISRLGR